MALLQTPTDPLTPVKDMIAYLRKLQGNIKNDCAPHVFPFPVSMANREAKEKWKSLLEEAHATDVKTISEFWTSAHFKKSCWLALGLMPVHNPVVHGGRNLDEAWHAFAIAVVKMRDRGKVLIIWDPDPTESTSLRPRDLLRCLQKDIHQFALSKCSRSKLYYNMDKKHAGKEECLRWSLEKIKEWVKIGQDDVFQGEDDLRVSGCIELE